MRRIFNLLAVLALTFHTYESYSQVKEEISAESNVKNIFDEKLKWGIGFQQYWGTIKGHNLPHDYFAKPCFGGSLRAEYYPLHFAGIGGGIGIQQRGAGIRNQDNYGGSYTHPWEPNVDPDSTYRERLRMNSIELPVSLLLRTPNDVFKGVRLSGAVGVLWIFNTNVKDFWHSPEDGLHTIIDVSDDYARNDFGYQVSFGADINAAESCIFQFHLVYTRGTKNVYKNGSGDGQTETYGFRLSWLF